MVPTFDKFLFPVLNLLKDGQIWTNRSVQEKMKEAMGLSDDDANELTPGGGNRFKGNVNWALTFLKQAELTTKPKNGYHRISDEGLKLLDEGISELSEKELVARYGDKNPKFFYSSSPKLAGAKKAETAEVDILSVSPEEAIHDAIYKREEALISELLEKVKEITPADFEKLVVQLLVKMGYGGSVEDAASVTKFSGDEGIDGIIKEDILGLDTIYIQAKHYKSGVVGRPEIQAFVGALSPKHAKKGVFITTSTFSKQAVEFAKAAEARIILIDGYQLCKYMLQFNLGVSTKEIIEIKAIDNDYFDFE